MAADFERTMAAMSEPFISREDLGEYLRRDLTTDEMALIAVDAACDVVRDVTHRGFDHVENDTVIFSGDGSSFNLLLPELPVLAVDEVRVDGEVYLDWNLRRGGILASTDGKWPEGDANIEVDYDHGYPPADLPRSVRIVALTVAARIYRQGIVRQETTGGVSTTYSVAGPIDLTSGERYLLAKYIVDRQDQIAQTPETS